MPMYCKKCGDEIAEGLRVCLNCGEEVEYTSEQLREEFSDGVVDEGYYDSDPARQVELENSQEIKEDVRKHMIGAVLMTLLIAAAVIGIAIAIMASTKTGIFAEKDPDDLFAGQGEDQVIGVVDPDEQVDGIIVDQEPAVETEAEPEPEPEAAPAPEAEPETKPQTSQADEIRKLLVSKKWTTTIEGYDGEVEFKNDGSAVITATIKVLGLPVKKSLDAKYVLTDDCGFTFTAEFNGTAYGVSGKIEKVSDNELKVIRSNNAGTLTLKAA